MRVPPSWSRCRSSAWVCRTTASVRRPSSSVYVFIAGLSDNVLVDAGRGLGADAGDPDRCPRRHGGHRSVHRTGGAHDRIIVGNGSPAAGAVEAVKPVELVPEPVHQAPPDATPASPRRAGFRRWCSPVVKWRPEPESNRRARIPSPCVTTPPSGQGAEIDGACGVSMARGQAFCPIGGGRKAGRAVRCIGAVWPTRHIGRNG